MEFQLNSLFPFHGKNSLAIAPKFLPSASHPGQPKNGTHLGLTWDPHTFARGRNRECHLTFRSALQRYCFSDTYAIVVPSLEQVLSH